MKHLIVTTVVFMLALLALVFGLPEFLPEYADRFNMDFIYGYFNAGIIVFLGFYFLTTEIEPLKMQAQEAKEREEQIAILKNKLKQANQTIDQLQEKSNNITLSAKQAADYILKQTLLANNDEIQRLKDSLDNAIIEYNELEADIKGKEVSIEKLTEEIKNKNSGLAAYRQKIVFIKHLTSQIHLSDGRSIWDAIATEWKQQKTAPETSAGKVFVPSAPVKGKQTLKYKPYHR